MECLGYLDACTVTQQVLPSAPMASKRSKVPTTTTAAKAPAAPARSVPVAVYLRGMTAEDLDAVDRSIARRMQGIPAGAVLSRNAVMIQMIREVCAREESALTAEAKP